MLQFFKTPHFDYIKHRHLFFGLSGILALVTVFSLFLRRGPNFSIDFTGGTLVQGFFKDPVSLEKIRGALEAAHLGGGELQSVPFDNAVIVRYKGENTSTKMTSSVKEELGSAIAAAFKEAFADNPFQLERVEFVGPVVGRHLVKQAGLAIVFSMLGIVLYVAFRFKSWIWGFSGVFALAHDVSLTLGFLSVTDREVSITVIAALLTLAGYSINDTIVIFDRIRENLRMARQRKETLDIVINRSCNETLSRTVITSLTVFMVLLSLLFFGGPVLRDFSLALTFGVVVGSYSTVFIATPMVYVWQMRRSKSLR